MFALPWTRETVPHAVVEVTRECNLACRACYRQKATGSRPIAAVLEDVAIIERHQRVHTISLAGGEPTLHPDLVAMVRAVKARGHRVSLVTNAVRLSDSLLDELAAARLDIVMIHVDEGQTRPDLPAGAGLDAVNRLRVAIAERVASRGIAAGLCTTLYADTIPHLPALVRLFLEHPTINFLFATHAVGIPGLVARARGGGAADPPVEQTTNGRVMAGMHRHFGLAPYAYIPPTVPAADGELPCITYSIPVSHRRRPAFLRMESGPADRALVKASRVLAGRYLYFTPDRLFMNVLQIAWNALFSGRVAAAGGFLLKGVGAPLRIKRLVFENAPRLTPDGTVNCCDFCPNSTVRDGRVMPVCLADHATALRL